MEPMEAAHEDPEVEDDDEEEEDMMGESGVQLGFVERTTNVLFADADWRNWDGGKVGGAPIWLNPSELPSGQTMACTYCGDPLRFILQIYCPAEEPASGFHRALYLFCCKKRECLQQGSVKCLRTQLPRENPYYCFDPALLTNQEPTKRAAPLCVLCGCHGTQTCGQCKKVHYCSRAHQKEHWKRHKLECATAAAPSVFDATAAAALDQQIRARCLFPEFALQVEEEVFEEEDEAELKGIMEKANIWEDAVTEGGADEEADAKLTQADYQRAMGSEVHDPTYINFLTRVERGGADQVLRYCRTRGEDSTAAAAEAKPSTDATRSSKGLLLLSSDAELRRRRAAQLQASPCARCGAPRTFECQVMPQLLHFLQVDEQTKLAAPVAAPAPAAGDSEATAAEDGPPTATPEGGRAFFNKSSKDIDWGSLDVFTCSASCDTVLPPGGAGSAAGDCAYVEELVLLQPPVYQDS